MTSGSLGRRVTAAAAVVRPRSAASISEAADEALCAMAVSRRPTGRRQDLRPCRGCAAVLGRGRRLSCAAYNQSKGALEAAEVAAEWM
jgi:hypothetical protein